MQYVGKQKMYVIYQVMVVQGLEEGKNLVCCCLEVILDFIKCCWGEVFDLDDVLIV